MAYRLIVHLEQYQDEIVDGYFNNPEEVDGLQLKDHLMEWEYGEGEMYLSYPWGTADEASEFTSSGDTYYLVTNSSLQYASLVAYDVD